MKLTHKDVTTTTLGTLAERTAEHFLLQQGLVTLTKNYRCKAGEIDLIMRAGNTLVFVEVRMRSNPRYASALESVNYAKQQKLTRAALHFLQSHRLYDKVACRFDVVALDNTGNAPAIQWVKNAFGP
jgi:putative endonuclease